jgi:hypothetical protein
MAFLKFANATVVRPLVSRTEWQNIRVAGQGPLKAPPGGALVSNLVDRAGDLFGAQFDPAQYLLTHATIVASVDVFSPAGLKTGSLVEDGFRINRKFSDFRITKTTDRFINNNMDAWSRPVLKRAFHTFVGAHNFVEHVQVEDLSKGRIIDAVARDIGDSLYVDILIATDRKHTELVEAILDGKMGTLSMGCTVDGTICTKCGHWAADETEMCPHIKYEKGNQFLDEQGNRHRVAELCGHESIGPTGGVTFIEASWVSTPAFTGAVLRNVLEPNDQISEKAAQVLSTPPPQWTDGANVKAAASDVVGYVGTSPVAQRVSVTNADFLAGWMDDEEGGGEEGGEAAPAAPAAPASPLKDVEDQVTNHVLKKVRKRLQDSLVDQADLPGTDEPSSQNENVMKQATQRVYKAGVEALIRTASSDVLLVDSLAAYNQRVGVDIPVPLYRAALKMGGYDGFASRRAFFLATKDVLGRRPTTKEAWTLYRLSKIISQRGTQGENCTHQSSQRSET